MLQTVCNPTVNEDAETIVKNALKFCNASSRSRLKKRNLQLKKETNNVEQI